MNDDTVDDRDERGRFRPGWRGGPGRPKREVEDTYREILIGAISLDDWRRVVLRALDDALAGDARAREFLERHLCPVRDADAADGASVAEPFYIEVVRNPRDGDNWPPPGVTLN